MLVNNHFGKSGEAAIQEAVRGKEGFTLQMTPTQAPSMGLYMPMGGQMSMMAPSMGLYMTMGGQMTMMPMTQMCMGGQTMGQMPMYTPFGGQMPMYTQVPTMQMPPMGQMPAPPRPAPPRPTPPRSAMMMAVPSATSSAQQGTPPSSKEE
jgi:hypothetical protein